MKAVALIPARGGSSAIPGKNIKPLCGQPLLYWVCKAASECPFLDGVYVATGDEMIAGAVRDFALPKVGVIGRSPESATGTAPTEQVLMEFAGNVEFDVLFLIQATSPLLQQEDLQRGWEAFRKDGVDSVLSVVRQHRFVWRETGENTVEPVNYDPARRPRRQDFDGMLVENGAFYVTSRAGLLESGVRLNGVVGFVEMAPESYVELDAPEDWLMTEMLMRRRLRAGESQMEERIRKIRFVATDVDGCLTDSGMYYTEQGDELKKFNTRDGMAFILLREAGFLTGIITREDTKLVARRANKLEVDEVHQGALNKVVVMESILKKRGLAWDEAAFLGDDLGDVALLKRVGLSACPADAVDAVRDAANMHLERRGGAGVFRELAEWILPSSLPSDSG